MMDIWEIIHVTYPTGLISRMAKIVPADPCRLSIGIYIRFTCIQERTNKRENKVAYAGQELVRT